MRQKKQQKCFAASRPMMPKRPEEKKKREGNRPVVPRKKSRYG